MHLTASLLSTSVLLLGASVAAQGTYTTYGVGCGSAGSCASANATQTTFKSNQNSNIFAMGVPASSSLLVVLGFELYTQAVAPTTTLPVSFQLYYADSTGRPTGAPVKKTKVTIGSKAAWYRATFGSPLIVKANQKFFLSYDAPAGGTPLAGNMKFPFFTGGTKVEHYWHSQTAATWSGPFTTQYWGWKVNCATGAKVPTLSNTGVPTIGTSMTVNVANARANATTIFGVGVSNTAWGAFKLPWDLTPLGAKGCSLLASLEFMFFVKTDAAGSHSFKLSIPNDKALIGVKFYNQYIVDDPAANPFGLAFSNGGVGTGG